MIRLVQPQRGTERRVALVDEPHLRLLAKYTSVYILASAALRTRVSLAALAQGDLSDEARPYDDIYSDASPWRIVLPIDHPIDPARGLVSGTGLTHLGSAKDRQVMHSAATADETDSMPSGPKTQTIMPRRGNSN